MKRIFLKGFSLIEMLIAIAVVAIILAIGLPSFKAMFDGNKLKGGSDGVYFMLSLAKTESIKRNKDIYLKITPGTNWCIGVNEDNASCDCNATPSTCDITSINSVGYEGLTLSSTYTGPKFDRVRGAFDEPDKFFTLQSGSNTSVQIRLNILGSVRMCGVNGVLGLYSC
ncbi:GspH/FimT family pseudopilin [Psychromonas sp. Urea-02u-13]|uniref:GspH/FimT family pseudopilin n=1 Tax=Psychromonas sp. Urea-02u-13 TaxID=2058326 RepID=UPI0012FE8925|nr:GspH/FimT family pseudopilin [Psychromonas sp. Urea-02u-13]